MAVAASGGQTLAQPGFAIEPIVEAVMQATGPPLPELDALGQQAVTAPVRRTLGCLVGEAPFGLCQQALQLAAVVNHPALRRGPGTQAAAQWAHLEISIGFAGVTRSTRPSIRTWRSRVGQKKVNAAKGLACSCSPLALW